MLFILREMSIYGNKHQLVSLELVGRAKVEYSAARLQQKLAKTGDTVSGVQAMGSNRITGVFDPAFMQDVATKI